MKLGVWIGCVGLVVAALVGVGGCAPEKERRWVGGDDSRHPLSATELRVHPLTRFVQREGDAGRALDLHFELLDTWGHSTKALGRIEVTLNLPGDRAEPLLRWTVDLTDPNENAEPYDKVTRAYRFLLTEIPEPAVRAPRLELDAVFEMLDGTRLRDRVTIDPTIGGGG